MVWRSVKVWLVVLSLFTAAADAMAQASQYAYRVSFANKNGSPALTAANTFLSARSLARRTLQGIALDETDRPVTKAYVDTALSLTGGVLHLTSKWFNHAVILLTDSSKIHLLQGKPWITGISYIAYYSSGLHLRSTNDEAGLNAPPPTAKATGSAAYYGTPAWTQTDLVHGDYLHDMGYKGQGKIIAVLDAGFSEANTHKGFDSLNQQGRMIDQFDFVQRQTGVYSYSSHGMQVLSTMAGNWPGTYVGCAPNAQYVLYRTEDPSSEQRIELDNMVAATERADSIGADIVNSSLGYDFGFDAPSIDFVFSELDGKTTLVARAANLATTKGMLFVTTAGNDGLTTWQKILTPGDADSALTVGSCTASRTPAVTSGYGPNASNRIKPDVSTLGEPAAIFGFSNGISSGSGTSYATPQIAGWAACLWQSRPNAKPGQIRDAINRSAHLYTTPGAQLGYGVPNFQTAYVALDVADVNKRGLSFSVYPNPFDGVLFLQTNTTNSSRVALSLMDITGRMLWQSERNIQAGNQEMQLDVPLHLAKGIYLLRISDGSAQQTIRLLK